MAVKIRMKRTGAKNNVCYRLVAADERSPRDGRNLEILGWYNPAAKGQTFSFKLDRVDYWLGVGAKISDTAASLLKKARNAPETPFVEEPVEEKVAPVVAEQEAAAKVEEPVAEPVEEAVAEESKEEEAAEPVEKTDA
jgi:small subunit ribosomal protein S16